MFADRRTELLWNQTMVQLSRRTFCRQCYPPCKIYK
ncbi:hypothetical protein X975_10125, partial [Stegodyphus mimosarum]